MCCTYSYNTCMKNGVRVKVRSFLIHPNHPVYPIAYFGVSLLVKHCLSFYLRYIMKLTKAKTEKTGERLNTGFGGGEWLPAPALVHVLLLWYNTDEKQLVGGKRPSGLYFQATVRHGGKSGHELKQQPWRNAVYWSLTGSCLAYFFIQLRA